MLDRSGRRLDNYHLIHLLGVGSYGEVYLAEHIYHKKKVAIKLLPQLADTDLGDFLNEVRAIRLVHPHIVHVQDFGIVDHLPFIVMDYAPHGTLLQKHPKGTRVPLDSIVSYVGQIASALQFAHDERLIHRDIKTENLLLGPNNEVLVSDFGIATVARTSRSQNMQEMAGTIAYMAPEQLQGKPCFASDQYALGVIVYEWLCGERPFKGAPVEVATQHLFSLPMPLREKIPDLAPDIEQVVMTTLAKNPKDRFACVNAFATALEQAYLAQSGNQEQTTSSLSDPELHIAHYQENIPSAIVPLAAVHPAISSSPDEKTFSPPIYAHTLEIASTASTYVPAVAVQMRKKNRRRLVYPVLALSAILAVVLGGSGAYYWWHLYQIRRNIDLSLMVTTALVRQANSEAATNPADGLQKLNEAQKSLRMLQVDERSFDDRERSWFTSLLQNDFIPGVKQAIISYNKQSLISSVPCAHDAVSAITNGDTNTRALSLVAVRNKTGNSFYVLGEDHSLYRLNEQYRLINKISLPGNAQPIMIANADTHLMVLASLPAPVNNSFRYMLFLLSPDPAEKFDTTTAIDSALTNNGYLPTLVTATGQDIYVVLTSPTAPTSAMILDYPLNCDKTQGCPRVATIPIEARLVSIAAFPRQQLFLLFDNGDVQNLPFAAGNQSPINVMLQSQPPIAPALATSANDFTLETPVPGNQPIGALSLLSRPQSMLLAATIIDNTPHLYIADNAGHRVLDLLVSFTKAPVGTTTPTPTDVLENVLVHLQLFQQYASAKLLAGVKSIAINPSSPGLYLLAQSAQNTAPLNLVDVDTDKLDPNVCSAT